VSNLLSPYVTDLEATIESLQEACRQRDDFIATFAHELRNPITALRAVADLHAMGDQERRSQTLEVVARQVDHLERLIDDAMQVSILARQEASLEQRTLELSWLVGQVLVDRLSHFEDADVSLDVELPRHRQWVVGDLERLGEAVSRLLDHALKASSAGGGVTVSLGRDADEASLLVTDSGPGVPDAELEELFEAFSTVRGSGESAATLGLGLAIVRGLFELHGGRVGARSDGQGVTFEVRLPLVSAPPDEADRAPAGQASRGLRRVLVIDNDRALVAVLAALLEMEGSLVEVAHDCSECLERLEQVESVDAIICATELAGELDGYAMGRALSVDPRLERTHMVAMSGPAEQHARERSFDCGFEAHLSKPLDLERLRRVLSGS
jgi:CheY-like chemotaxis protein